MLVGLGLTIANGVRAADQVPKGATDSTWTFLGHELTLPSGKAATWIPKDFTRLYKVAEDKEATGGKALQIFGDQRALRKMHLPILETPPVDCPVGVYKVTVRLKLAGMLGVIGTPIQFTARQVAPGGRFDCDYYAELPCWARGPKAARPNWETYTIHGYHFKQEGVLEEFSFLTEVLEPDAVSKRPMRPPPRNGAATLLSKAEIEAWKQGKGYPWDPPQPSPLAPADAELVKQHRGKLVVDLKLLATCIKSGVDIAFIANSIRSLTVDTLRIERVPEAPHIVLRQILPRKTWILPGTEQIFAVWLHNRSGASRKGKVRVRVVHGIDQEIPVGEKDVVLENQSYQVLDFPWKSPAGQNLWGCAAVAELVVDGKVVSSESDMFSVHRNVWAVRNSGSANRLASPYYRLPCYVNTTDWFGSTPGDALKPFPDDPAKPYACGMMTGTSASFESFKIIAEANRKMGAGSFLYIQPACGTGTYMEEAYLKHPEWFVGPLAWTDQYYDGWDLAQKRVQEAWDAGQPVGLQTGTNLHIEDMVNHAVPEVFQNMLAGMTQAMEYASFDGVRWDASPAPVNHTEHMGVKYGPEKPEELAALLALRIREIKEEVRKRVPRYTESANWGPPQYVIDRKATRPEKDPVEQAYAAFLADGSSLMDEGWMSAGDRFDCRNAIRDYLWAACQETQFVRKFGGYWYSFAPGRDSNPYFNQSIIYYGMLVILSGGSYLGPAACPAWSETGIAQFSTRFSEFLSDARLRPVPEAAKCIRLMAPKEIWCEDSAVWRDLPDGKRRYTIPIVNPPTIERFFRKDRFSELPEPFREPFGVEVDMPEGFTGAKVWTLTAEPRTAYAALPSTMEGGVLKFDVPDLFTFRVLVIEFSPSKGAG